MAKAAAREREKAARAAERERASAARRLEQARRAEERAYAAQLRAAAQERKRLEKSLREAHVAAKTAEAERLNADLDAVYEEIDTLLAATLDVDDFVDLESLRVCVDHPPFDRDDLEEPIAPLDPISEPRQPVYRAPDRPLWTRLLGEGWYRKKVARVEHAHQAAMAKWQQRMDLVKERQEAARRHYENLEGERKASLKRELKRYESECAAREAEAEERNSALDSLITNLAYGTPHAVEEYVSIVMANSVYPETFPVRHEFTFDAPSAELRLKVLVAPPDTIPTIKAHKYVKSADEIRTTALSKKACRDRYLSAVGQVALRSLHEVFEADRRGIIKAISLELGTETIAPATGVETYVPFIAVASDRETFVAMNLANVVPQATLAYLGGAVSKDPYNLIPVDTSGIRRS